MRGFGQNSVIVEEFRNCGRIPYLWKMKIRRCRGSPPMRKKSEITEE